MIDLATLFEPGPPENRFADLKAELKAVASGEKAMSVFCLPRSDVGARDYEEIVAAALNSGLSVTHHAEKIDLTGSALEQLYVFVLAPEESWRIPAYIATRRILREYQWSDGAEYLESYLLGYSEQDISAWIASSRNTRASWTGKTIYLLITDRQVEEIADLGMRCLDPRSVSDDVVAFFPRGRLVLRSDAPALVPEGMVIARAAVEEPFFRKLFGASRNWGGSDVVSSMITKELVRPLNAALESNLELFYGGGWR